MYPKFKAYVPDADIETDVLAMEWNHQGVTWVTLLDSVPRAYRTAYGSRNVKRVPANRVILKQVGYLEEKADETDTK